MTDVVPFPRIILNNNDKTPSKNTLKDRNIKGLLSLMKKVISISLRIVKD
jgi:hypothetical protein